MSIQEISVIILCLVIIGIVVFKLFKYSKEKSEEIKNSDDLFEFLSNCMQNTIIPYLTKLALDQQLTEDVFTYEDFKEWYKNVFIENLYSVLNSDDNKLINQLIIIPDNLEQYLTKDIITRISDKIFDLDDVDTFLKDLYDKLIEKRWAEMNQYEDDVSKENAMIGDVGTDYENKIFKPENCGVIKTDDNNYMDISASLNESIPDNQLIEIVQTDEY